MTVIERVARAMCATTARNPDDIGGGPHPMGLWLDEGEPWWKGYEEAACAAIAALREPTDAMMRAATAAVDRADAMHGDYALGIDAWTAAIDSILSEQDTPHGSDNG